MVVAIAFRLYDAGGDLIDEVTQAEPLRYVHGYAQIIPGLEAGLADAEAGEERSIVLFPEDAFGEHDPEAILEIDPDDFPEAAAAVVGGEIVATGPDGVEAVHRIIEIDEDAIIVDLNHPLAGEALRFEVRVCSVRPASDDELDEAQAEAEQRIAAATGDQTIAHDPLVVYGSVADDSAAKSGSLVQLRVPAKLAPSGKGGKATNREDE